MRIVSGKLKGRRFEMPNERWETRPTTDYAKESLFNILNNQLDFEGLEVLDLFAGTGNIGYEFLSRGAKEVTFVEKFAPCVAFIQKHLELFKIESGAKILKMDVFSFLKKCEPATYDVVFADPPYGLAIMAELPDIIFSRAILKKEGTLIIEHDNRQNFENHPNFAELRTYGQSFFSFFELKGSDS